MERWQLVHSDGEEVVSDDCSSVSSDWSILVPDDAGDGVTSPPHTAMAGDSMPGEILSSPSSQPPTAHRRRRRGTAVRREQHAEDKSTVPTVASVLHNAATAAALAQRARTLSLLKSLTLENREARGGFDSCQYNRTHHMNSRSRHTTAMGLDRQRTKCFYRGAMTSKAYQRPLFARLAGPTSDNGGFSAANAATSGRMARKSRA